MFTAASDSSYSIEYRILCNEFLSYTVSSGITHYVSISHLARIEKRDDTRCEMKKGMRVYVCV